MAEVGADASLLMCAALHVCVFLRLASLHQSIVEGAVPRGRWRLAAVLFAFEAPAAKKCVGVLALLESVFILDSLRMFAGACLPLGPTNFQIFRLCCVARSILTPLLLLVRDVNDGGVGADGKTPWGKGVGEKPPTHSACILSG